MTNVILYLFIKYIKKSLQNPPPHKINPLKSVQSVAKTLRKNPKIQKTQQNQPFAYQLDTFAYQLDAFAYRLDAFV